MEAFAPDHASTRHNSLPEMTDEAQSRLDLFTEARIAALRDTVRRSHAQLILDREMVARSRHIVKESAKRLQGLQELPVKVGPKDRAAKSV